MLEEASTDTPGAGEAGYEKLEQKRVGART